MIHVVFYPGSFTIPTPGHVHKKREDAVRTCTMSILGRDMVSMDAEDLVEHGTCSNFFVARVWGPGRGGGGVLGETG